MRVNVVDTTPPTIVTNGGLTTGSCGSDSVTFPLPSLTDACSSQVALLGAIVKINGAVVTPVPLINARATVPPGPVTVRWTATDASGNVRQVDQDFVVGTGVRTNGRFAFDDRARLQLASGAPAPVSNSGTDLVQIGADTQLGNITSISRVTLADRSRVDGFVLSAGSVVRQGQSVVTGSVSQFASVVLPPFPTLAVTFPTATGNVSLEPNQHASIQPGAFTNLIVKSRATLTLASGIYYMDALDLEPQGQIILSSGGTQLFVRNSVIYRGTLVPSTTGQSQVVLSYTGTNGVFLESPFTGAVFANNAALTLGSDSPMQFSGHFLAKSMEVRPATVITCGLQ